MDHLQMYCGNAFGVSLIEIGIPIAIAFCLGNNCFPSTRNTILDRLIGRAHIGINFQRTMGLIQKILGCFKFIRDADGSNF